jgi:hypothetical protein
LLGKIRLDAPATLQAADIDAPESFERILRRALAKRPQDRFESTKQLVKELESVAKAENLPL